MGNRYRTSNSFSPVFYYVKTQDLLLYNLKLSIKTSNNSLKLLKICSYNLINQSFDLHKNLIRLLTFSLVSIRASSFLVKKATDVVYLKLRNSNSALNRNFKCKFAF